MTKFEGRSNKPREDKDTKISIEVKRKEEKAPAASMEFFQPEQWLHLLEQMDIILATVQGDDSNPILRRFGPRASSEKAAA